MIHLMVDTKNWRLYQKNRVAWNGVKKVIGNWDYFIWYVRFGMKSGELCYFFLSFSCCFKIRN